MILAHLLVQKRSSAIYEILVYFLLFKSNSLHYFVLAAKEMCEIGPGTGDACKFVQALSH